MGYIQEFRHGQDWGKVQILQHNIENGFEEINYQESKRVCEH